MPVKKKTAYMKLIEADKQDEENKKLEEKRKKDEIEQEKIRAELRPQLISDYEEKVKITGQAKLNFDEEVKVGACTVLRPPETRGKETRKAVNGVYCLGKKIGNN